jgi:RES domain-containing protein
VPPRITRLHQDDTHRLIPARYTERDETVLVRLAEDDRQLNDIFELDGATNDRLLGEANLLPGISVHELVFGIPNDQIVNAAFTHARPGGNRFNGPERGAWYAAFGLETSQAEVAYHKAKELQEVNWREQEIVTYREYLADFRAEFHDIRNDSQHTACLAPDSYAASQELARNLLEQRSAGIVYPSVRHFGGTCVACFRPALVTNVRKNSLVTLTFADAFSPPTIRVQPNR